MNINEFDRIVVAFSGGKDSLACILHLLKLGVPKSRIELWHHEIDGREGSRLQMDWPCTPAYCKAVAEALDIPIYFSWRAGGFEKELLRNQEPTAATFFETPAGLKTSGGKSNRLGTRLRFPQVSGDLRVRWCSAYLKIMVSDASFANQTRFKGIKTLLVTGERRQESANRAKYNEFEKDRSWANCREVWRWRPIIDWTEASVWEIIEEFHINAHPAYHLGFSRVSCMLCIFASDNQLASVYRIAPERIRLMAEYEDNFGVKIHRKLTVMERVARGASYIMAIPDIRDALSTSYIRQIIVSSKDWRLPNGAFNSDKSGPT